LLEREQREVRVLVAQSTRKPLVENALQNAKAVGKVGAAAYIIGSQRPRSGSSDSVRERSMAWTTPVLTEVCVGMEVTSYASAEI
jgi:coenzyme PQQ precursor peptide PqqA